MSTNATTRASTTQAVDAGPGHGYLVGRWWCGETFTRLLLFVPTRQVMDTDHRQAVRVVNFPRPAAVGQRVEAASPTGPKTGVILTPSRHLAAELTHDDFMGRFGRRRRRTGERRKPRKVTHKRATEA